MKFINYFFSTEKLDESIVKNIKAFSLFFITFFIAGIIQILLVIFGMSLTTSNDLLDLLMGVSFIYFLANADMKPYLNCYINKFKYKIFIIIVSCILLLILKYVFIHTGLFELIRNAITSNNTIQARMKSYLEFIQNKDFFNMAYTWICVIIIAPIFEETFYRGFLYGIFKSFGYKFMEHLKIDLPVSKILFVLFLTVVNVYFFSYFHEPVAFVTAGYLSVASIFLYEMSGSIFSSIFLHSLFNLIVTIDVTLG